MFTNSQRDRNQIDLMLTSKVAQFTTVVECCTIGCTHGHVSCKTEMSKVTCIRTCAIWESGSRRHDALGAVMTFQRETVSGRMIFRSLGTSTRSHDSPLRTQIALIPKGSRTTLADARCLLAVRTSRAERRTSTRSTTQRSIRD